MSTSGKTVKIFTLLKRLWGHLGARRQIQFKLVLLLMIVSAFMEVISLGAVIPFLGVLIAPEKVFRYELAVHVSNYFNIFNPHDLLLPLTIIFACAAVLGACIRMLLLWSTTRVVYAAGSDISYEVYKRTIYQPFLVHLSRNSSEVSSGLSYKLVYTIGVMYQVLVMITSFVLVFILFIALILTKAYLPLASAVGFGVCYILISFFFRKKLLLNSKRISDESTQVMKTIQEGLGGIRDILLDGTQDFYCDIYRKADYPLQYATGDNIFIGGSPRFIMEALSMLMIAVLSYALSLSEGGIAAALPLLGALALGAQRLLPSLQQSYASWAGIVSSQSAVKETLDFLDQPILIENNTSTDVMPLKNNIKFNSVSFRYREDTPYVLHDLSLTIPKGKRVGIVGGTGSGKSTLLDLLMGLIIPSNGSIEVDDVAINTNNKRSWQRAIAHVPQAIYLADASLAENIAFGISKEKIDMTRMKEAAERAQVSSFVENIKGGYNAFVGERGSKLSGGQRQRIGIARALYKNAEVLLFDEATSALDNNTEQEVMNSIDLLDKNLTIVIVAHRLTTIKKCDFIIEMSKGKIVSTGTYEELLDKSESFKKMVNATDKKD